MFEEWPKTIAWEPAFQRSLKNCSKEIREEPGYIAVLAEKQQQQQHIVECQKITNHTQKNAQASQILVPFYLWKDARVLLTDIIPLVYILTIKDQQHVFLHLNSSQGTLLGVVTVADGLIVGNVCLCLLKWQVTFLWGWAQILFQVSEVG